MSALENTIKDLKSKLAADRAKYEKDAAAAVAAATEATEKRERAHNLIKTKEAAEEAVKSALADVSKESEQKDKRIDELERALRARGKALGEAREAVSKAAVLKENMEKRHEKEVAAAIRRGEGEGEALRRREALRKARSEVGELRESLKQREEEVESLRIKLSESRERLKSVESTAEKRRSKLKEMSQQKAMLISEKEAVKLSVSRERDRWNRMQKEQRKAKAREIAAARAEIEGEAKLMVGETMRAAMREVERLSMLCREQKNEISSLRSQLTQKNHEGASGLEKVGDYPSLMETTASSVNESLRGLTREDLNESGTHVSQQHASFTSVLHLAPKPSKKSNQVKAPKSKAKRVQKKMLNKKVALKESRASTSKEDKKDSSMKSSPKTISNKKKIYEESVEGDPYDILRVSRDETDAEKAIIEDRRDDNNATLTISEPNKVDHSPPRELTSSNGAATPHWSPLHSSEERWLDLGMSPHRRKPQGYTPHRGKVSPLKDDYNSALGIHEPRSTIKRSPSAAVYHRPTVVANVSSDLIEAESDSKDSNKVQAVNALDESNCLETAYFGEADVSNDMLSDAGEDRDELDRSRAHENTSGDLDDSIDLGARLSSDEMLRRLGIDRTTQENALKETCKEQNPGKSLGLSDSKDEGVGISEDLLHQGLETVDRVVSKEEKRQKKKKTRSRKIQRQPRKKKDKLTLVEQQREQRIFQRERRKKRFATRTTIASSGVSKTSYAKKSTHSGKNKVKKRKKDKSYASSSLNLQSAALRRAAARKDASEEDRRSSRLKSSQHQKASSKRSLLKSKKAAATKTQTQKTFSGSSSMRVLQSHSSQHLGGFSQRSSVLNNSYSGSIGLAHGDFVKLQSGTYQMSREDLRKERSALRKRWAEIKTTLEPRHGLRGSRNGYKKSKKGKKSKSKSVRTSTTESTRLGAVRAEKNALLQALQETEAGSEQGRVPLSSGVPSVLPN